ncbi:16918_t:CDS:2 [Entrophospora sp. SA101]|nr:16918_t:CDS:2 [Entrophospora sp. SA101]
MKIEIRLIEVYGDYEQVVEIESDGASQQFAGSGLNLEKLCIIPGSSNPSIFITTRAVFYIARAPKTIIQDHEDCDIEFNILNDDVTLNSR